MDPRINIGLIVPVSMQRVSRLRSESACELAVIMAAPFGEPPNIPRIAEIGNVGRCRALRALLRSLLKTIYGNRMGTMHVAQMVNACRAAMAVSAGKEINRAITSI